MNVKLWSYGILISVVLVLSASLCGSEEREGGLSRIRERGKIIVITRNNAHCYYIYRGEPMGFEYDLAGAFAEHLGVKLGVRVFPWSEMINSLNEGRGDFIACSKAITPAREKLVGFSEHYLSIQQRVIVHKGNHSIREVSDLDGKVIHVQRATAYEERLSELRESGIDCTVMLHEDVPAEELIRQVAEGTIEITIANSNIAQLNRRYYPNIKIGIPIEEPQGLGWAVRKGDKALIRAINGFFNKIKSDGSFDDIYKSYHGNVQVFDRLDVMKFHRRIKRRLPKYESIIKIAAEKYGFDWRLIAAVIYQESHFNPRAKSHRGVRGLMQLTLRTAQEMGVTNRLDPEQSIMGGVKYLRKLYERYYKVQGFERMLIALASYNVGPRHIRSAQKIAGEKGLDPYRWSSLEKTLPLLCYERIIEATNSGYCRGTEPVRYVNRILLYFDILRRKAIDGSQFSGISPMVFPIS
jgi:membrane-bound lytic murein transglycosylase F